MSSGYHNVNGATHIRRTLCPPKALDAGRFWGRVRRGAPDACWLWQGSRMGGRGRGWYGQVSSGVYAHRTAWILTHGAIPEGQSVLHRCDVPLCCNPAHLFLGTHTDNMRDAAQKGRLHVPRPKRQKVSPERLAEIDALLASGATQADIARQFGVSRTWVCMYAKGTRRQYDRPTGKEQAA